MLMAKDSPELRDLLTNKALDIGTGFSCLVCGQVIKKWGHMRRHMRDSHAKAEFMYRCPHDGKMFGNKSTFYTHVYTKHREWRIADYRQFMVYPNDPLLQTLDNRAVNPALFTPDTRLSEASVSGPS